MINRRSARERVLQALYAHALGGGDRQHIVETLIRPHLSREPSIMLFAEDLFEGTLDSETASENCIREHTNNWELKRMALMDRLILRIALCELQSFEDIPPKVTINEAIEIAKRFSTESSGGFVNGVLDSVIRELEEKGELFKSGRGLKGMHEMRKRMAKRAQSPGAAPESNGQ